MPQSKDKPKPFLFPEYCKGCGRCISACAKDCIHYGTQINATTGLVPIVLDLEHCNSCGLCIDACPEPYGLAEQPAEVDFQLMDPEKLFGARQPPEALPESIPDELRALAEGEPLVLKGAYASALGALLAGCRHFFGYPITPSTEGAEFMAKYLPRLGGTFIQAVSEVATVNMMYGAGGAGVPSMTFTSSPGFSLMLEGISYMIGGEVPGVFVDIMRGGPGLGNIAPEQSDVKLACRGLGHGNTNAIVLMPSTPQEMLDLTMLAFELAFKYRHPVVILGDGYLGQMTGKVALPKAIVKPGIPSWAVHGDKAHQKNLIVSIYLAERDLEAHNVHIIEKYKRMIAEESRVDLFRCDDAEVLVVACNTPARMAKGAVEVLRQRGVKAGLFRPVTIWPFPIEQLKPILPHVSRIVVVEASNGQIEDELRLALSHGGVHKIPEIEYVRHYGGILPEQDEIVAKVLGKASETTGRVGANGSTQQEVRA